MTSANTNCLPAAWLPEGSDANIADDCTPYDGSRLPDCTQFDGQVNTTSFYHVHEWDCGMFWECGPDNHGLGPTLCLFQCAECIQDPNRCPDGRLQFDCRYGVPEGPVCDFADEVNCDDCREACAAANCPPEQNCDSTTGCKCSDCRLDSDCPAGQMCCDRNCADHCGSTVTHYPTQTTAKPTDKPTTTKVPTTAWTTPAPTTVTTPAITTPCPTDCCADSDCPPGHECVDGNCVQSCTKDSDCDGWDAVCETHTYSNCNWCNQKLCRPGCAQDANCPSHEQPCTGIHACGAGFPGLTEITITTDSCTDCRTGNNEGGIILTLNDPFNLTCNTDGLDNQELKDYTANNVAKFLADDNDGMGYCGYANLNFNIKSGTAKWTGTGVWTGASHNPLCFYYYDNTGPHYIIYNCCDLQERALSAGKSTELVNCRSCVLGKDC